MRSRFDHVERIKHSLGEIAPKRHRKDAHRTVPPAETLARLLEHLPAMGITRVANVTGLDRIGIPVVMACRPNARSLAVAQGKGASLAAAKVSGIMESIETHHAEHIHLPVVIGSHHELCGDLRLMDVALAPRSTNEAFSHNAPMPWIAGYDLMQEAETSVPLDVVHTNYTADMLALSSNYFTMTSTGLASGNHLLEAISHAICEVVERDALALWRLLGEAPRSSKLALEKIGNPVCEQLLAAYRDAEVAVHVWDVTSDVGIPVYVCLIHDRAATPVRSVSAAVGAGCHLNAGVALSRALTEAAQSRLTFIAGSRDDMGRALYDRMLGSSSRLGALLGGPDDACGDLQLRPNGDCATFREDIRRYLECLRAVGVTSVIAIDLTKPEFEIPVVRVVIPGLECAVFGHDVALARKRAARCLLHRNLERAVRVAAQEKAH